MLDLYKNLDTIRRETGAQAVSVHVIYEWDGERGNPDQEHLAFPKASKRELIDSTTQCNGAFVCFTALLAKPIST